ncbi:MULTISPECIES: hypothetical protein [Protofrankia]|uniref:Uncharacterized protein n=1 Tax=Candidatus Protofrankia datiscae TaxID=2716812 RepID=F8B0E2_9ACTN|nr:MULTISPECIES: hypothetical protein [Protofrankia]AEH08769.1 hypothetical protein FsymDg_1284 [Candidatus Protofrankia datiscae]
MRQPASGAMTPAETRLAEALVSLVDYTGRILLIGLADANLHYVGDKAGALAEVADRVAGLAGQVHQGRGNTRIRMDVVARAVAAWSQPYTAGRLLFPRPGRRPETSR